MRKRLWKGVQFFLYDRIQQACAVCAAALLLLLVLATARVDVLIRLCRWGAIVLIVILIIRLGVRLFKRRKIGWGD